MATCRKCGEEKDLECFYKDKTSPSGRQSSCKECVKENSRLNRIKRAEREPLTPAPEGLRTCSSCGEHRLTTEFYKDSSKEDGLRKQCKVCDKGKDKARYEANKEEVKACSRAYYVANAEHVRSRQRKYYSKNKDMYKAYYREYFKDRPGLRSLYWNNRQAREANLPDTLTDSELRSILEEFGGECAICCEEYEHLDHFIPISTGHGGTTYENIVPMCAACNLSKSGRNPFIWAKQLSEKERERFDSLVRYLSDINGIAAVEDYEAHVTNCFK